MASFSAGSATLFVEESGVSFVEYSGSSASMGESGGPVGPLEKLINDAPTQAWIKEKFGESTLQEAIAEARRLIAK